MFRNSDMITRQIRFVCPDCKSQFMRNVTLPADMFIFNDGDNLICNPCGTQRRELEERKAAQSAEFQRIEATGVKPEFRKYDIGKGNRTMLEWILSNSENNMLIISEVNSGKTRAACKALLDAEKRGLRVRYVEFVNLSGQYSGEKKESTTAAQRLINRILGNYDILLIDDIDKGRISATTGEMMYKILNTVYSGASRAKVWLTANHTGAELLGKFEVKDDGAAVLSRIERMADDGKFAVKRF